MGYEDERSEYGSEKSKGFECHQRGTSYLARNISSLPANFEPTGSYSCSSTELYAVVHCRKLSAEEFSFTNKGGALSEGRGYESKYDVMS